jgi:type I restriction enzyme, S subunit
MRYPIKELITEKLSGEWGNEPINGKGYKVIRTTNFTNLGIIDFDKIVTRDIDAKKVDKKHLKNGDIIIEKSGGSPAQPVGRVVFFNIETDEKILCNNFTAILRPNKDLVIPKYFHYQLHFAYQRGKTIRYQNKTTGIINLQLDKYLEEKIEIPSLSDQLHIANLLTKAENLISQRKESIRLLDEFLKSTFLEMFGDPVNNEKSWKTRTIEQLIKKEKYALKRGPFGGALKKEIFVASGYLVYEQFHALNNDFTFGRYFIDEAKFNELKGFEVKPGDIIISCSGVYLGKLAIVPHDAKKGIINQALLKISLDNKIIRNDFFVHVFSNKNFKRKFYGNIIGTGIPNFPSMDEFKKFNFIYPPIELQTQFAQIVEKTEALKTQYQQSLQELENLYGSLSQRAFRGELSFKDESPG